MPANNGLNNLGIDKGAAIVVHWSHTPEEEDALEEEVEREPPDEVVREKLQNMEKRKYHPVCQPTNFFA